MMGSYSLGQSGTSYANVPVTQENVSNPNNLTNSKIQSQLANPINLDNAIGSWAQNNVNNSMNGTFNISSDQQTVNSAFDFGSKLVQVVADITRQNNASQAAAANDETKAAATGTEKTTTAGAIDWTQYKTELMIGAGILAWWFLGRKK